MSHAEHRLVRLVESLPIIFGKDAAPQGALAVTCTVGATWVVTGEVLTSVPASGTALRFFLRDYTISQLAAAIDAVSGYDATVVGATGTFNANTLVDQVVIQPAGVPANLTQYTSQNFRLLAPMAVALDDYDDAFEDAVTQLDMRHAEGPWLDLWGNMSGLVRYTGEVDSTYAARVRGAFITPKQNGFGLVALILTSPAVVSAYIADGIIDNFTRPDASALGNADSGQPWIPILGGWGVSSFKAYASQVFGAAIGFAVDNFGSMRYGESSGTPVTTLGAESVIDYLYSDLSLQITFSTVATGSRFVFRHNAPGDEWWVEARSDRWALVKVVSGAATDVGTYVVVPANGDIIKVTFAGPSINVFLNGVSRITTSDAANQTGHKAGLAVSDPTASAVRFDNFIAGVPGTFIVVATMAATATAQDKTNLQTIVNKYKASGCIPTFVYL